MPNTDVTKTDISEHSALIDELEATLAGGDVQHRLKILQRVTDLFVAGSRRYSGAEIAVFDDVLSRLAAEIEIKARARRIQRDMSRRRMLQATKNATVVITNPTHFAVALQYERGMSAPVCVAKGADLIARKIREVAEAHGIPVVENPPLARTLYSTVEIDQEIPQEHYRAVAEIIGYVMRMRRSVLRPA